MSVLVTNPAPPFEATAVMPDGTCREGFTLEEFRGRYVLLFFYPFDFSAVCPTELLAIDHRLERFRERECEVVAISTDTHFVHRAWRDTAVEDGGIGAVQFPLVADVTKQISRDYGVLLADALALRATFLIDRDGVVRYQVVNDPNTGRDIDDTLRTLDAVRHVDRHGRLCPAGWDEGDESIEDTPAGVVRYLKDFGPDL
ncbi:MAG: peroxiredoxin [Gemmatimonadota bacterium]